MASTSTYVIIFICLILPIIQSLQRNLDIILNDSTFSDNSTIFWNSVNDVSMLQIIQQAEKLLKVYVYPIPKHVKIQGVNEMDTMPHFYAE